MVRDLAARPAQQVALLCPTHAGLAPFAERLSRLGVPVTVVGSEMHLPLASASVKLLTVASAEGLDSPVVYLVRVTDQAFGRKARADEAAARKNVYVALTRAGQKLVVSTVQGKHHPLVDVLDDACYDVAGSLGKQFVNRRGLTFPTPRPDGGRRSGVR